jgi:primosomal replication protein N
MKDYLEIGPTPADEPCVQIGEDDYMLRSRAECRRFAALIERAYPGACAVVRANRHDYGTYYEVNVSYDDDNEDQTYQAFLIADTVPATWAELERMAEEQDLYMHKETGSTCTKAGWRLSYQQEELEARGLTADQALAEDIGRTLFPTDTPAPTKPIPTETPKKDNHMHDLNSILLEGVVRISPIYTEHKDGLTARFVLESTRRPKDSDPVTILMPVDAHGRLAEDFRAKYRPDTYIRVVGRLAPNSQPSAPPAVIIEAEHIEYRAISNLT